MDEDVAAEMFRRLAIALEIVIDMRVWSAGIVQRVTSPRRAASATARDDPVATRTVTQVVLRHQTIHVANPQRTSF
jgi:hypothetical protein